MTTVASELTGGISTVGTIFTGIWNFITDNPIVFVMIGIGVVMVGIALFKKIKSRIGG